MWVGAVEGTHRNTGNSRVVVKIMVPFGVLNIVQHLCFRVPKKGP